jgi:hypothetical protein
MPQKAVRKFLKQIRLEVNQRATELGFAKVGSTYTSRVRDGWLGWLGINVAVRHDTININPVVGVVCVELERLLICATGAEAEGQKTIVPSVSTTLSSLMGTSSADWTISSYGDTLHTIDRIFSGIPLFAIPYFDHYSNLERLRGALAPGEPNAKGAQYRFPMVLFMLGETEVALDYLNRHMLSLGDYRASAYYQQYARFADGLRHLAATTALHGGLTAS